LAYAGHWRSVSKPEEREHIHRIEDEEWAHRKQVGAILESLGAQPSRIRELIFLGIGRTLGPLCSISGWLAPMYGAGFLESRNIVEYEVAARLAVECGRSDLVDCLLEMAEVEWDHERYFRERVLSHAWARLLPMWREPKPRAAIRRDRTPLAA
jgi:demethoxyubiquinone hydroxylase (CLK1/Coq7/Cat5 family)